MNRITKLLALFLAVLFGLCSCTVDGNTSDVSDSSADAEVSFDPDNAKKTLVSVGKPYVSLIPACADYPDIFGQQLTDGQKSPDTNMHYTDSRMVGYDSNGQYIIDLGEDGKRLIAFSVRSLELYTDGVRLAGTVRFSGSNDNENWEGLGTTSFVTTGDKNVNTATLTLDAPVDYRYIKVRIRLGGGAAFYFIDEIEVFADVPAKADEDTVKLSYESASLDKNAWKSLSTSKKAEYSITANVAAGKGYAYNNCVFDERAPIKDSGYADKLKTYLTDDSPTGRLFGEDYWVGFSGAEGETPSVTVDLGSVHDNIYGFRVHSLGGGAHLEYPDYVDFYGSKDGKNYVFLGRVYAPVGGTNFAYTLLLEEYVGLKSVRFEFGGNGTYWVEEVQVLAGYTDDYCGELYPPLDFPVVTEEELWATTESDYTLRQNLLKGLEHQISVSFYAPLSKYTDKRILNSVETKCLTDGKRSSNLDIENGQWFFTPHCGGEFNIFYDIGKLSAIDTLVFSFLEQSDWAINRPEHCDVYLSEDGVNWYKVGDRDADGTKNKGATRMEYEYKLDKTYAARFVRFRFECDGFTLIDELEAFGTKSVSGASRLANSGIKSVPFYTNYEASQYATTENNPIKADDINILYLRQDYETLYDEKLLLPYVAYLDEEGKIVDTMMDGFAYLPASPLPSGKAPHLDTVMSDWEWLFDTTFHGAYGFDKLDSTVATVKDALNKPDYKVQVYITILTVLDTQSDFGGDVDGDGVNEDNTTEEGRDKVIRWYVQKCLDEFEKCGYENLELGGFYWMNEEVIWSDDDEHVISQTADIVHEMGSYLLWIPYYTANRYYVGYDMGFDLVNMQPNVVFDLDAPLWRFDSTAILTRLRNMCVEIEHTYQAMTDIQYARNYMLYLYNGAVYGYMDAIHVYYNDRDNISKMGYSDDVLSRMQYDATYHFIKGDLDITPDTKDTFKAETDKNTILHSDINPEREYSLFTLASMPKHGTVSLSADGTFAYYPDKDFTGTDTFTYTYNNLLGESEECTVEIKVK